MTEIRDKAAALAHEQWSGWVLYMFSKGAFLKDGTWKMPEEFVTRWRRQMESTFDELSPLEQKSDYVEGDKYIALLAPRAEKGEGDGHDT